LTNKKLENMSIPNSCFYCKY